MAQTDNKLKTVFIGTLLWLVILSLVWAWFHFASEQRQAEREVIYLKARQLAAQQQRQRTKDYEKRMREQRLRSQYQEGAIIQRTPLSNR